jgi:hypothetical protein
VLSKTVVGTLVELGGLVLLLQAANNTDPRQKDIRVILVMKNSQGIDDSVTHGEYGWFST